MRVLWLCNRLLEDRDGGASGTWLGAMAQGLLKAEAIELGIIGFGVAKRFARADYGKVQQWAVPGKMTLTGRDGLPPAALVQLIVEAAQGFRPDLIHVWGTERFWGLLTARKLLRQPALLEIQGLKFLWWAFFYGGLSLPERLACIGIKEVLKRRALYHERRDFLRWGAFEREMIRGHRFIDAQSPWTAAHLKAINPGARLFKADRALRAAFGSAAPWQYAGRPVVFTTAAYSAPFKGLHVAIRAIALLRQRCPGVRLSIAGPHQRSGIRRDGYVRWINRLVHELGMDRQVEWLGALPAAGIARELQSAGAALIPTFVESYCVAMAEAMHVGTPTVAAFTGGTSYLGRDEQTCLFFPPGDAEMCAFQLDRVLNDRDLALRLSRQAREAASARQDGQRVVLRQIETYEQCLGAPAASGQRAPPGG